MIHIKNTSLKIIITLVKPYYWMQRNDYYKTEIITWRHVYISIT